MAKLTVRHITRRVNASGQTRYYWQPSSEVRRRGFSLRRLSDDYAEAIVEAERLNSELDAARSGTSIVPSTPSPRERRRRGEPGKIEGVYVIGRVGGPFKIGVATDPTKRLLELQTATAEPLFIWTFIRHPGIDAFRLESAVHKAVDKHRKIGEWFGLPLEDATFAIVRAMAALIRGADLLSERSADTR